jgi:hypothetical protein
LYKCLHLSVVGCTSTIVIHCGIAQDSIKPRNNLLWLLKLMFLLNGAHKTLLQQVFSERIIGDSPPEKRSEVRLTSEKLRKHIRLAA